MTLMIFHDLGMFNPLTAASGERFVPFTSRALMDYDTCDPAHLGEADVLQLLVLIKDCEHKGLQTG